MALLPLPAVAAPWTALLPDPPAATPSAAVCATPAACARRGHSDLALSLRTQWPPLPETAPAAAAVWWTEANESASCCSGGGNRGCEGRAQQNGSFLLPDCGAVSPYGENDAHPTAVERSSHSGSHGELPSLKSYWQLVLSYVAALIAMLVMAPFAVTLLPPTSLHLKKSFLWQCSKLFNGGSSSLSAWFHRIFILIWQPPNPLASSHLFRIVQLLLPRPPLFGSRSTESNLQTATDHEMQPETRQRHLASAERALHDYLQSTPRSNAHEKLYILR